MRRHRRFGNVEVARQFAGAQRSRAKQGKDPAPRGVCQSSKNLAHICNLAKYRNTVKTLARGVGGSALIPRSEYARIPEEAARWLRPCTCGGKFSSSASPRCPDCLAVLSPADATSWIEADAPGTAKGWHWQRNWVGIYAIIVNGKVEWDPWL
jgi:hypothetical protein